MAKSAFVLPDGVEISTEGGKLSLRYHGDVILDQTLGLPIGRVEAGGDLTVRLDEASGDLRAGGRLVFSGRFTGGTLHGAEVVLGSADVKARAVSADERIEIGPARLQVDIIIAPEILIAAKASGRVTVIQSGNERGPTKIKGGFSLAEYEEVIGDADEFLAERGLSHLAGGAAPRPVDVEPTVELVDEPPQPPPPDEDIEDSTTARPEDDEEDIDDPLSLSIEDLEPIDDDMYGRLSDAVGRIISCYAHEERPPSIDQLQDLISTRDYDALRENITDMWNGLLAFHQARGIRPHHQVTHAFNVIHGLVQEG